MDGIVFKKMEDMKLKELSLDEIISIEGGNPTADTSFWYDFAWCVGFDFKKKFCYGLPW